MPVENQVLALAGTVETANDIGHDRIGRYHAVGQVSGVQKFGYHGSGIARIAGRVG